MISVFAFLFATGFGFGMSCWIFGTLLDKSNNIGDSTGGRHDYHANVHFIHVKDKMSQRDAQTFAQNSKVMVTQGAAPSSASLARKLSPEEIEAYAQKTLSDQNGGASGPVKDARATGVFKSTNTIYDDEAEFAEWEQKNAGAATASPFRKLDTRD